MLRRTVDTLLDHQRVAQTTLSASSYFGVRYLLDVQLAAIGEAALFKSLELQTVAEPVFDLVVRMREAEQVRDDLAALIKTHRDRLDEISVRLRQHNATIKRTFELGLIDAELATTAIKCTARLHDDLRARFGDPSSFDGVHKRLTQLIDSVMTDLEDRLGRAGCRQE